MPTINEHATITSKGQITLPKSIRQLLGVDTGGKIAFDLLEDGRVIVSRVETEHQDPAISAFLSLLANDIKAGVHVSALSDDLARSMLKQAGHEVNLDEDIDGEVSL